MQINIIIIILNVLGLKEIISVVNLLTHSLTAISNHSWCSMEKREDNV